MSTILESLNITSPYLQASITILLFIVIAVIANLFITKLIKRITGFTRTDVDDRIIELIHKPLFFTVLLVGIVLSISYLELPQKAIFSIRGLIYSAVIITWIFTLVRIFNVFFEYILQKQTDVTGLRKDIVPFVENLFKIVIVIAALMALFSIWKINITPLIASAGIAGAAVAFAAKDTMANFIGGISLFADKPFKIGDYIILDQGERGEVVEIGIRSTRIKTRDDILITIPNSIIANTKIINESAPVPKFRIRIPVSVAYGSDIDHVEKVLLDIASKNAGVVSDPESRVRFRTFGDSSLNFELLCWTKEPALRGRTLHELNSAIYKTFNEMGIKIPFPQRDVHLYKNGS